MRLGLAAAALFALLTTVAPYQSEEEAVQKGERLEVGAAALLAPGEAVVDSTADLGLRFTVGKTGMKRGGGLRIATGHGLGAEWGGARLQTTTPQGENYLSFRASTGAALQWTTYGAGRTPLFDRYHPWQLINEFKLAGADLQQGDTIEVLYGAVRMQRWDETGFELRFYVDAFGDDDYLPLRHNPRLRIRSGPAAALHVSGPSEWTPGQPGWIHVWAEDGFGNPAEGYQGTIALESDAPIAGLPAEYTFRPEDRGARRFENLTLAGAGVTRVRASENNGALRAESNPLLPVGGGPRDRIWWGDLHNHTSFSDGRGSAAEAYDFARRVAALDFAAVTDHDFVTTDPMWREIRDTANRLNQPHRFVTLLAYEWSGATDLGGDHNVYTSDNDLPLYRCYSYFNYRNLRMYRGQDPGAAHVEQLFRLLGARFRDENLLVIPHFGGRQGNPEFHDPRLQRQIEIFSDHRRSEDWASKFLVKGYRLGIMASTDNHAGNAGFGVRRSARPDGSSSPAERGTALVAAYAPELTRQAVFQAIYHRATYATTGERIILRFSIDGAPMGSEIRASKPPRIAVEAHGTAPIAVVRVVKSGRVIHEVKPGAPSARFEFLDSSGDYRNQYFYVELEQADGEKAISSPIWVD